MSFSKGMLLLREDARCYLTSLSCWDDGLVDNLDKEMLRVVLEVSFRATTATDGENDFQTDLSRQIDVVFYAEQRISVDGMIVNALGDPLRL